MWFTLKKAAAVPTVSVAGSGKPCIDDEEIPRYPPFMRGLPAASISRVIGTQKELIDQLKQTLGLEPNIFETLILPVLHRYVAFVHLLPASESHHHRGAGGLLRHGLEAAFFAARSSEGVVFLPFGTPRERHDLEPKWHVAVALAGLLHDLGKSVADVAVTDRNGKTEWQPYLQTLLEWAGRYSVERYFLRWNERRHKQHEMYNKMVADRVLTPEIIQWLCHPQPEIARTLFETITMANTENKMYRLVADADRKSVESDLKANHVPLNASLGVPVEKHILDAMRCLITNANWVVNQQGGRIWVLRDGVYVVWKHAAQEVVSFLEQDRIPGIPRNPDTLADILIERGFATPRNLLDGTTYRYWPVSPSTLCTSGGKAVVLYMLKLASPQILFSIEPPTVDALIGDEVDTHASRARSASPAARGVSEVAVPTEEKTRHQLPEQGGGNHAGDANISPADPREETADRFSVATTAPATEGSARVQAADDSRSSTNNPARWLECQGEAGALLLAMARDTAEGRVKIGEVLALADQMLIVVYPGGLSRYGEPSEVMGTLEGQGWITVDPVAPLRKVRESCGVRGLVLAEEPARHVRQMIEKVTSPSALGVAGKSPTNDESAVDAMKSPAQRKQSRRKSGSGAKDELRQEACGPQQLSLDVRERRGETTVEWPSEADAFIAALMSAITKGEPRIGQTTRTADGRFRVLRRDVEAASQNAGVKLARLYTRLKSTPGCSLDAEYLYVQAELTS